MTTNFIDSIALEGDNRRFIVYIATDRFYRKNKDWFASYFKRIADPKGAKSVYEYLMNVKLPEGFIPFKFPVTQANKALTPMTHEPVKQFLLSAREVIGKDKRIKSVDLHALYVAWSKANEVTNNNTNKDKINFSKIKI